MRYLHVDLEKCDGGRHCHRECELACAKMLYKTTDVAFSAIRLLPVNSHEGVLAINVCDQCGECVAICPVEALKTNKLGVVMLDKKACVACYMCVGFCPTLSMRTVPGLHEPVKCIVCGACVKVCPMGALQVAEKPAPEPLVPTAS
ncbi:MAG: 4Fe-4S binding protein [Thermoanaerobaculaceae bacterium]|nr:4Fe-4S binding protein [Thermoanaerobaculaceae bacterium]MDI9622760.1 4Fe-4S binding protein [Acidobacteriota bacterium]NLH10296.1 4Fe-4S binding protein [Holophagae bacterium]HPW56178.1 4Fe-4S binding protein [Thermoanaerobaculaceae bacterium]